MSSNRQIDVAELHRTLQVTDEDFVANLFSYLTDLLTQTLLLIWKNNFAEAKVLLKKTVIIKTSYLHTIIKHDTTPIFEQTKKILISLNEYKKDQDPTLLIEINELEKLTNRVLQTRQWMIALPNLLQDTDEHLYKNSHFINFRKMVDAGWRKGRYDLAFEEIEYLINEFEKNNESELKKSAALLYCYLAGMLAGHGLPEEALDYYKKAEDVVQPDAKWFLPLINYYKALIHLNHLNPADISALLEENYHYILDGTAVAINSPDFISLVLDCFHQTFLINLNERNYFNMVDHLDHLLFFSTKCPAESKKSLNNLAKELNNQTVDQNNIDELLALFDDLTEITEDSTAINGPLIKFLIYKLQPLQQNIILFNLKILKESLATINNETNKILNGPKKIKTDQKLKLQLQKQTANSTILGIEKEYKEATSVGALNAINTKIQTTSDAFQKTIAKLTNKPVKEPTDKNQNKTNSAWKEKKNKRRELKQQKEAKRIAQSKLLAEKQEAKLAENTHNQQLSSIFRPVSKKFTFDDNDFKNLRP